MGKTVCFPKNYREYIQSRYGVKSFKINFGFSGINPSLLTNNLAIASSRINYRWAIDAKLFNVVIF